MKSKTATYLLLVALVIIWGLIVKNIFFSDPPIQDLNLQGKPVPITKKSSETALILNYPDPFFVSPREGKVIETNNPKPYSSPPQTYKEELNAYYAGKIKSGKIECYMIVIDGTTYTFNKGQTIEGVKLIAVSADSVYLEKNRHRYSLGVQ